MQNLGNYEIFIQLCWDALVYFDFIMTQFYYA